MVTGGLFHFRGEHAAPGHDPLRPAERGDHDRAAAVGCVAVSRNTAWKLCAAVGALWQIWPPAMPPLFNAAMVFGPLGLWAIMKACGPKEHQ